MAARGRGALTRRSTCGAARSAGERRARATPAPNVPAPPARSDSRRSDDERVVAARSDHRGEDAEDEPDCDQLAVLGDGLPWSLTIGRRRVVSASSRPWKLSPSEPTRARTRSPRAPRSPRIARASMMRRHGEPGARRNRPRIWPAAGGGCASRPSSRARRSSAGAGRHRARSRARGTSPPTRPRSGMRLRRQRVCRSSVTSVDRVVASPPRSRSNGHASITARVTPGRLCVPGSGAGSGWPLPSSGWSVCASIQTEPGALDRGRADPLLAHTMRPQPARTVPGRERLDQAPELRRDRPVQPESPAPRPPGPAPRSADQRAQSTGARGRLRASLSGAALRRGGDAAAPGVARAAARGARAEPGFDRRRALEPDRVQSSRVASLGRGRPGAPRATDQPAPPRR